ncbi:MAG: hypothetical protein KU38_03360 [Sulfurovum sp. FS08-3]|nr:MAG: hypothetical protein KU38_03360 [Sulfurovum sp. FS08-3]
MKTLNPLQKIEPVDRIFNSLEHSNKEIDTLWAKEAQSRLKAYDSGRIKSIPINEVFQKYQRG